MFLHVRLCCVRQAKAGQLRAAHTSFGTRSSSTECKHRRRTLHMPPPLPLPADSFSNDCCHIRCSCQVSLRVRELWWTTCIFEFSEARLCFCSGWTPLIWWTVVNRLNNCTPIAWSLLLHLLRLRQSAREKSLLRKVHLPRCVVLNPLGPCISRRLVLLPLAHLHGLSLQALRALRISGLAPVSAYRAKSTRRASALFDRHCLLLSSCRLAHCSYLVTFWAHPKGTQMLIGRNRC